MIEKIIKMKTIPCSGPDNKNLLANGTEALVFLSETKSLENPIYSIDVLCKYNEDESCKMHSPTKSQCWIYKQFNKKFKK